MSPIEKAKLSLDGLSVGDAFGERFFGPPETVRNAIENRITPPSPWYFTDDTVMAIGIAEVLEKLGHVDQDELAAIFARNYNRNPRRGYGRMAHHILQAILAGRNWKKITHAAFGGMGSFGNGGAMRVAPLGAYFSDDIEKAAAQAAKSAEVTHGHPEGQAGAVAVAVAAAWARENTGQTDDPGTQMMEIAHKFTPESKTREGIKQALALPFDSSVEQAAKLLGSGYHVSSQDTVPFCLWCAARHIDNYEEALWNTVAGFGDIDTTCAIVGGIVSLCPGARIPGKWLEARESLEEWHLS